MRRGVWETSYELCFNQKRLIEARSPRSLKKAFIADALRSRRSAPDVLERVLNSPHARDVLVLMFEILWENHALNLGPDFVYDINVVHRKKARANE